MGVLYDGSSILFNDCCDWRHLYRQTALVDYLYHYLTLIDLSRVLGDVVVPCYQQFKNQLVIF